MHVLRTFLCQQKIVQKKCIYFFKQILLNSNASGQTSLEDYFKSPFSVVNIYLLPAIGKYSLLKRDGNWIMWLKNITINKRYFFYVISQIWQTFKCSGTVFSNLAWYRRTKDLVPLFTQKCTFLKIVFWRCWPSCNAFLNKVLWETNLNKF